jgi:peptidyl-prolyl cis-trans isomerase B (cyclophilin B)
VVDGFIAQGGDPNGDGTGGSEKTITGEFSANGVNNTLSHVRGTVSMARADDYNSATSQFFICYDDLSYLDGSYAAFGSITEGMEVIDGFLDVPRTVGRMGEVSVPETPIVIEHAAEIEADTAGNPRIQFLIRIDSEDAESTESTEAEAGTEATEETVVATAVEETVATEEETVDAVG